LSRSYASPTIFNQRLEQDADEQVVPGQDGPAATANGDTPRGSDAQAALPSRSTTPATSLGVHGEATTGGSNTVAVGAAAAEAVAIAGVAQALGLGGFVQVVHIVDGHEAEEEQPEEPEEPEER
jgi:hypothetical protein